MYEDDDVGVRNPPVARETGDISPRGKEINCSRFSLQSDKWVRAFWK